MFAKEDQQELDRYLWVQQYCLDQWLANMQLLDLFRPSIERQAERTKALVLAVERRDLSLEDANRCLLEDLRHWWQEYEEVRKQVLPVCPN